MEYSEGAARTDDPERSGRGGEGETEIGGAEEQGWAPAPATTGRDSPLCLV